jgi:membrane associated rhomboid family serine protease
MIPLKDDAPRLSTPWVTYFLLLANIAAFLMELTLASNYGRQALDTVLFELGVVPERLAVLALHGGIVPRSLVPLMGAHSVGLADAALPYLTSMFLHGSWLHLIFNMWALWIFGDNVEDHFGHSLYLLLYLGSGIVAALLHTIVALGLGSGMVVPVVGASGAIAGIMGAYFVLFPSARVLTLVPFIFVFFVWLPAWVVLGWWFIIQFLSGAATAITAHNQNMVGSGVAVWAHVGGFLTGMLCVPMFPSRRRRYRYYGR